MVVIDSATVKSVAEVNDYIWSLENTFICICNSEFIEIVDRPVLLDELNDNDVVHAGLLLKYPNEFDVLAGLSLNWNFLNPTTSGNSHSWKGTADFVCFGVGVFKKLNGLVVHLSLDAAIMEFCFRALVSGAKIKCSPQHVRVRAGKPSYKAKFTRSDVLYFVRVHLGWRYFQMLRLFFGLKYFSLPGRVVIGLPPEVNHSDKYQFKILHGSRVKQIDEYTAIIPTIDRYDFIGRSIESLLKSERPPGEIIVVDQTPLKDRKPHIYSRYIDAGILRVFYLDSPGQSTARNKAIELARNDWLLLWEDDTEAWPEMIAEHVRLLEYSEADVSTGISLAPWKDLSYIPDRLRKFQIADVLATGNAFLHKNTALSVGGLDPAFDRGSGADDDFGKRLFLGGKLIVFNHKAIQTHHKAPRGGMRVHGAWWRNKSTLLGAYPPATQLYAIRKYYPRHYRPFLVLALILKAKKRYSSLAYLLFLLLLPLKLIKSIREANRLRSA